MIHTFVKFGVLAGALGTMTSPATGSSRRSLQDHEIRIAQELLITAPAVVDSPLASYPGPWSFGHLMEQAFGKEQAPVVTARWLKHWRTGVFVRDDDARITTLPPRKDLAPLLVAPWQQRDGHDPASGNPWIPDFRNAPFRLLAIVNRMDLAVPLDEHLNPPASSLASFGRYSGGSDIVDADAGEGRLVFGLVDASGQPVKPGMTLIFEYGLDLGGERARLFDWAMAWHRLGGFQAFDNSYRSELAELTRAFTDRIEEDASAERPASLHARLRNRPENHPTSLIRIRTNDGAFGVTREFREFTVHKDALRPAPIAGTPREEYFRKGSRDNRWLARWLQDQRNRQILLARQEDLPVPPVPTSFILPAGIRSDGLPVTAMVSPVTENNADYHWDGWGLNNAELRRSFSMQTCCGCHCGDTNTTFFHIAPREAGTPAALSKFLRTNGKRWRAKDPGNKRSFLSSEMEDRKQLFEAVLNPNLRYREIDALRQRRSGREH